MRISIILLSLFISSCSQASEQDIALGQVLYGTGQDQLAERILPEEKSVVSKIEYFNLLISGRLGQIEIDNAKRLLEDEIGKDNYAYPELKAAIFFFENEREKAISLLENRTDIDIPYTSIALAKEYIDGKYVEQNFHLAYEKLERFVHGYTWEPGYLLAKLGLGKKIKYQADTIIVWLLASYMTGDYPNELSDKPTMLLIHLAQDGVLMPKNDALAMAIAMESPVKSNLVSNALFKIYKSANKEALTKAFELAANIYKDKNKYLVEDRTTLAYILKRIYRINSGPKRGVPIDFPAYDVDKVSSGYSQ